MQKALPDFNYYVRNVYTQSFEKDDPQAVAFAEEIRLGGEFIDESCHLLQYYPRTIRVLPRDHIKSQLFYAHIQWKMMHAIGLSLPIYYMSYQTALAESHIKKIKDGIRVNPFFAGIKDEKIDAEGRAMYCWNHEEPKGERNHITIEPFGMLAFKRGTHGPLFYVDDPLRDPENKLDPKVILKINRTFQMEIMPMPYKSGQLHVAGTPQTDYDFFFDKDITRRFKVMTKPAIIRFSDNKTLWDEYYEFDPITQKAEVKEFYKKHEKELNAGSRVLWTEHMDYRHLMEIRREGEKSFEQEYQVQPVYSADAYFNDFEVDSMVNPDAKQWKANEEWLKENKIIDEFNFRIAGHDIGKKAHPAHLTIYDVNVRQGIEKWKQIYQHFYDRVDYKDQLDDLNNFARVFKLDFLGYDNTRGEFEGFAEQGLLPSCAEPITMNRKENEALAALWDKKKTKKQIELLPDDRQKRSIKSVQNDLKALTTPDGHGDAFFSTLCALAWEKDYQAGHFRDIKSNREETETASTITGGLGGKVF